MPALRQPLDRASSEVLFWYETLTKSSITVRRGLRLLRDATDRAALREGYRAASLAMRDSLAEELRDLDALTAEGLDEV